MYHRMKCKARAILYERNGGVKTRNSHNHAPGGLVQNISYEKQIVSSKPQLAQTFKALPFAYKIELKPKQSFSGKTQKKT